MIKCMKCGKSVAVCKCPPKRWEIKEQHSEG